MNKILFFILVSITPYSFADQEITTEIKLPEKAATTPHLREKLIEAATQKATEDLLRAKLGEKKFTQNLNLIDQKIVHESDDYFSVVRPGPLTEVSDGTTMKVSFRVNEGELAATLKRHHLEEEVSHAVAATVRIRVLPMPSLAVSEKLKPVLASDGTLSSVKERVVEKSQIVYEAESSVPLAEIAQSLRQNASLSALGKTQIQSQDSEIWIKLQD